MTKDKIQKIYFPKWPAICTLVGIVATSLIISALIAFANIDIVEKVLLTIIAALSIVSSTRIVFIIYQANIKMLEIKNEQDDD